LTRRRSPRPAAAAIRAARERFAPRTRLAAVQGVWTDAVGEHLAAVTEPVRERRDSIVVSCRGSVWAEELDLIQGELLERLRGLLGEQAPAALRFEAREEAPPQRPSTPGWPAN
jgi:hypothetical protein